MKQDCSVQDCADGGRCVCVCMCQCGEEEWGWSDTKRELCFTLVPIWNGNTARCGFLVLFVHSRVLPYTSTSREIIITCVSWLSSKQWLSIPCLAIMTKHCRSIKLLIPSLQFMEHFPCRQQYKKEFCKTVNRTHSITNKVNVNFMGVVGIQTLTLYTRQVFISSTSYNH